MQANISPVEELKENLTQVRKELIDHPLYHHIKTLDSLKIFSQNHVFAVWDFMTLLKALQIRLTCVTLPWKPIGDAETRYLINEIVTGEESDVDQNGDRSSHYELYLKAMRDMGADSHVVEELISKITIDNYASTIQQSDLPDYVKSFLNYTFSIALDAPTHILASVFTFGREDLIPDMFIQIVQKLSNEHPEKLHILRYYFERHIEVDGDEHSILGIRMVEKLCGNDPKKWNEASTAAQTSLKMRLQLWDGILKDIKTCL